MSIMTFHCMQENVFYMHKTHKNYFKKLLNIYLLNYNFEFKDFVLLKSTSVKKNTNIDDLICSIAKYTHFAYVSN